MMPAIQISMDESEKGEDITPSSSISRLRLHLPNEADQIQLGRDRYIK